MYFKTRCARPQPALEALEVRCLPTANFGQTFVATLYQGDLHRNAENTALVYWSTQLNGGASVTSVADQNLDSFEAHRNSVQADYAKLLGRNADGVGQQYWQSAIQNGATLEQVAAGIAASDEFFQNAGGTADGYVKALYAKVLGRNADSGGETYFDNELQQGASRVQVAAQVTDSSEAADDLVNQDYQQELGRPADSTAFTYWTPQIVGQRLHDEDVAAGIAGSNEYITAINNALGSIATTDPNAAALTIIENADLYAATSSSAVVSPSPLLLSSLPTNTSLTIYLQPASGPLTINATTGNANATGKLTSGNNGATPLNFQATGTLDGPNNQPLALTFDHPTGTVAPNLSMIVNVGVDASGLPAGTYTGTVTVADTTGAAGSATEEIQVVVTTNTATIPGTYTGTYQGSALSQNSSVNVSGVLTLNITKTALLPNSNSVYTLSGSAEADNFFGQDIALPLQSVLSTFSPTNSINTGANPNGVFADAATDILSAKYIEILTGNVSVANGKYVITGTVAINDGQNDWLGANAPGTFTLTQN